MASNLSAGVMDLQDMLVLVAGIYFGVSAIEISADPLRRKYPPDTIKMTTHFVFALFLIAFWFYGLDLAKAASKSTNYYA
jgi:hypothetical protein